jgi:hypothetical protein
MTPSELTEVLRDMDVSMTGLAQYIEVSPKAVRQWADATRKIPQPVAILLAILRHGLVDPNRARVLAGLLPVYPNASNVGRKRKSDKKE